MRYPEFLNKNGTIGFVAPSFGCNIEPYRSAFGNAQKKLAALGHGFDIGPNCYAGEGIGISNTPPKCGSELTEYYCSENNDVLISCGGGELMCETMDFVDFDRIKAAKPKWYMGFSDNTNFTFLLTTICDVASIYAPCAASFGMEPWHQSIQDAYDILTGSKDTVSGYPLWEKEGIRDEEHPYLPYNLTEKRELHYYLPGKHGIEAEFQGRLIGGCMDCLVNLAGTNFDHVAEFNERYADEGIIWFLEACDLNVLSIRRALWNLEHAGWFKNVKGFLIGRPLCFGSELMGMNQYNAVTGVLAKYNVPIIMDLDIGHLSPMMPLVCGSYARVRAKGNDISIKMSEKA
ncbi:MAG: S66 peptidase family protein [Lachnospiraceae bacterium]